MPIVKNDIAYTSKPKDGLIWGASTGSYSDAAINLANILEIDNATTVLAGHEFTYNSKQFPPTLWSRYRGYTSFFTSGWKDAGWAESAKIRLYLTDSYNFFEQSSGLIGGDEDWTLVAYAVSGFENRDFPYVPDDPPGTNQYGFGDSVLYNEDWGAYPPSKLNAFNEIAGQITFSGMYHNFSGGTKTTGFNGLGYRIRNQWIEIPIPLSFVNSVGESQFRFTNFFESENSAPYDGGDQTKDSAQWVSIASSESSNDPELVITYVTPTDAYVNELRNTDLSIRRKLQNSLNLDTTLSGTNVYDGHPAEDKIIDFGRSISLEHLSTIPADMEIGSKKDVSKRRFSIDVICDRRGEMQDLEESIFKCFQGSTDMLDFRYGFINPPSMGKINFSFIKKFNIPNVRIGDSIFYRTIFNLDIDGTTVSGL